MGVIRRPRLLSDNGPCYVSRELADYLETHQLSHTRGAPYHPMTQGKIERYHRSMNNVVKLEKYYSPWKLDRLARSYRRVSIKVGQVLEISMRQAVGDRFLDGRGHGAPSIGTTERPAARTRPGPTSRASPPALGSTAVSH